MDDRAISLIIDELAPLLRGRHAGKIFQLGALSLAVDFGLRSEGFLFISIEPALSRIYLIKRRVRDLEKQSMPLSQFALVMRKELSQMTTVSVTKDPTDRIVRFKFAGTDDVGEPRSRTLVAQLTGRSANLFLLDESDVIIQRARAANLSGRQIGDRYSAPDMGAPARQKESELVRQFQNRSSSSLSQAADAYFTSLLEQKQFATRAAAVQSRLRKQISQQQKLLTRLQGDQQIHAGAEDQKRIGDLLLANVTSANRTGNRVRLVDYFASGEPEIEIEVDEKLSLVEEAARRFAAYSRSKRAAQQIEQRIGSVQNEIEELRARQNRLEEIVATRDEHALAEFEPASVSKGTTANRKTEKTIPGTRRYVSSDGFEILVGRAARDNDFLTFKVAKPNDAWLHAADYGGSHVVVRNPTRKELPHRTLVEAAQLAAQFSQARKNAKVDVHHTERKFVSKPKGAAPGLVRLARFKTIVVEPKESGQRVL